MALNQQIGESVQDSVRLGMCSDLYYYGERNSLKQCFPTIVNNKFQQNFTSLSAGSSQFLFSPNEGLTDVMIGLTLPTTAPAGNYNNLAVPRGWGYHMINQINWRYAGSSQYYVTGGQHLVQVLRECNDAMSRDFMYQLGGAECKQNADFAGDALTAFCYIKLPHNSPNGNGSKPLPFPTDLLVQPVIITVILNPIQSIFSTLSSAIPPSSFSSAYFQVKQVMMNDSGDLLSRRENLNEKAYSYPVTFYQQEYSQQVSGSTSYQINLTGFRSGEVKNVIMWVTKNSDQTGTLINPFNLILPGNINMTYNGDIIYLTQGSSSLFFDMVSSHQWPGVSNSILSVVGASFNSSPVNSYYVTLPFAQFYDQVSGVNTLVHGKQISNAIVNLSFTLPDTSAYTCHFQYLYNSTLLFNKGSTDYVF